MKKVISAVALLAASAPGLASDSRFPIWGEKATELGYTLPKPWGLSVSYMDMSNPVRVQEIGLSGSPVLEALEISAPDAEFEGYNTTLRGDLWVLPFWNVYGIVGYTSGESVATIRQLSCNPDDLPEFGDKILCGLIDGIGDAVVGAPFALDLSGPTYGLGTTFAGGIGNWFGVIDTNYTLTDLRKVDGKIKTLVTAPRVGYRWEFDGGREFRLYAGGMYQRVQQDLSGDLADLIPELALLLGEGRFDVKQSASSRWNTIVGAQYALNRDWELLIESGFGARRTTFLSLTRRM